jgi:hypothetical protein
MPSKGETKHHFVAFIISDNSLIMLNGTKEGPAPIEVGCSDLLTGVADEVKRRLEDKNISESISLIAIVEEWNSGSDDESSSS